MTLIALAAVTGAYLVCLAALAYTVYRINGLPLSYYWPFTTVRTHYMCESDNTKSVLQGIFDKVATHLLTQGEKAQDMREEGELCMYRTPNNNKCAVGALISDEAYSPRLEGNTVQSEAVSKALTDSGIDVGSPGVSQLLWLLQLIHDRCNPVLWPSKLRNLAAQYGLSAHAIDDFEQ